MPETEAGLIPPHCVALHCEPWVDIGLSVPDNGFVPELYRGLLAETERLQASGHADLFFFVHKPPGLRWRLHAAEGVPLVQLRRTAISAAAGLLGASQVRAAVYEPQQALFGGTNSMDFVHRLWSQDSLLWLRWHAGLAPLASRWAVSLTVLAHVFNRLGIIGWEDREVWTFITEDTGRRLADHEWTRPEVMRLAAARWDSWEQAWYTSGPAYRFTPTELRMVEDFREATEPILSGWRDDCLNQPVTRFPLTPRRAAAYWTVFHWNRARISGAQQALTAQTLAGERPHR
jgi:thiopeptide-type bacteriocin biosynthesis protein